ncbi:hypothetical protein PN545_001018 [Cronobacter sakazakii]|nr:hypothetical protein [Cronobacter sakazakii]
MNTAKLKAAADMMLNATEISNQLRHLADNEIDSDSFAVVTENYNGREVEFERPITDLAIDAAGVIDELIAALEAARADCRENAARIAELESQRKLAFSACNRWADKCRDAEKRVAELETRTVKLPPCVDDLHGVGMVMSADAVTKALSAAGINLETGGEA